MASELIWCLFGIIVWVLMFRVGFAVLTWLPVVFVCCRVEFAGLDFVWFLTAAVFVGLLLLVLIVMFCVWV